MPVIATGWGYDELEDLAAAGPDYLARNTGDLADILTTLNLIT